MSALRELYPVNPRVPQSIRESSEAPSSSARHHKRDDSIISNLNINITSTSTVSSSNFKVKQKQHREFHKAISKAEASLNLAARVLSDLENASTQNTLTRAVDLLGDSPDATFQSENGAEGSRPMMELMARIGPAACLPIMLGMQEKIGAALHSYNTYLLALEQLLEDACASEEDGGLLEPELSTIYSHLETTLNDVRVLRHQKDCLDKAVDLLQQYAEAGGVEVSLTDSVENFRAREVLFGMPTVEPGVTVKKPMDKKIEQRVERWQDLLKSRNVGRPVEGSTQFRGLEYGQNSQVDGFPDDESMASDGEAGQSLEL
ncbi:hypothetical protein RvY_06539-2 [Ramazzottius varieornatus]|uniref:Uncharacterized protein n=1 Tax=Ramazzottius varieornatus TaxID=947166 RepID=A0A1D1UYY7_RAMVA|nr:hypothetical protein RvY_06539-2 [Ramazzottius varieornatus]